MLSHVDVSSAPHITSNKKDYYDGSGDVLFYSLIYLLLSIIYFNNKTIFLTTYKLEDNSGTTYTKVI